MPVAKSYQSYSTIGNPFTENGRQYILIQKGTIPKKVRFYNDKEYARLYPTASPTPVKINQKEVFGFHNGYITIFTGDAKEKNPYFQSCQAAQYNLLFGWYIPSTKTVPNDLPSSVTPITLKWETVGNPNNTLKPDIEIHQIIDPLRFPAPVSEWQGSKDNPYIEKLFIVIGIYTSAPYTAYELRDVDFNFYTWITMRDMNWTINSTHYLSARLKEHIIRNNIKITCLTRCKED